ncbi:MAG: DUF4982 domain-containing protein [Chitinophagaceae bacterium]|nr:DUF4982 domain-containing protein [Chitinophagaceae bacterium]
MKFILALYCVLIATASIAQIPGRIVVSINDDWQFRKGNDWSSAMWGPVNLPHTWNKDDVMDDIPSYYRGPGWYRKKLTIQKKFQGKKMFLYFEGANQVAEVFINDQKAGKHIGGYSGFYVPISDFIIAGSENEILVKLDNSHNPDIPPLTADFTFYGGIYRDVWLVATESVHFSFPTAGNSVFISTPSVNSKKAIVSIKAGISHYGLGRRIVVSSVVKDAKGLAVSKTSSQMTLKGRRESDMQLPPITITNPKLWSPDSPYLYSVVSEIRDASSNKLLDQVTNPLGLRSFHFDAANGFFLNGKPLKLVGASRHQDFKGTGNAVPDSLAVGDIAILKKMGGNFLRVAHYPQDPSVLRACDSLGILASVEIPVVNEITESETFYETCRNMQVEMIRQHYNHPSVIIWCYMNEVLLRPHHINDKEKQKVYFSEVTRLAKQLDSITRKEDPFRYTMIAHHGDYQRYRDVGLLDISMIVGWNLYSGWYGAKMTDFPVFLDAFHKDYPRTPVVVSEYGADADPRIRSGDPVRFDKSVEYTTRLHQYYLTEMMKRPFVAGAMIWNLADFNSETRTESMPHINNKGLLEWDRTPKDPYYYYQAMLSTTPYIRILGRQPNGGTADSSMSFCSRMLQVATNADEVELVVNGKQIQNGKSKDGLCEWIVPFINGDNVVEVVGRKSGKMVADKAVIPFLVQPYYLNIGNIPFEGMNILLGANRSFTDHNNQVWVPDKEYCKGSWGHMGGKWFKVIGNNRLPYGTDKDIVGTEDDPVYQTQQMGIERYKLDVPAGEYELKLHFAELQGGTVKELVYNLNDPERIEPKGKRVFNVVVNSKSLLENFDIAGQYGIATPVVRTIRVTVENGVGIDIVFNSIEGMPVLNALQVHSVPIPSTRAEAQSIR